MRFLVDAQLPPALARWLTDNGHEAEHVVDIAMQAASDLQIWDYAFQIGAVIISKDEDFARRKIMSDAGPAIIWLRLPNTRKKALLAWFSGVFPDVVAALDRGESLVEVT